MADNAIELAALARIAAGLLTYGAGLIALTSLTLSAIHLIAHMKGKQP